MILCSPELASLGPPRPRQRRTTILGWIPARFPVSPSYCSSRPQRGPEVGGKSQSCDYNFSLCLRAKAGFGCNRQQKWCLRGVFDGTSRRESSSGRTQLARIKNWAKNARGGLISWSRWHCKSLAIPPRCASPAAYEGQAKFATTCAMATAQPLVAQRTNGPCTHGLETFRARRPLTLARKETTHTAHPRENRRATPLARERR